MDHSRITKRQKFVTEGLIRAELHEFFSRTLSECGYAGMAFKTTPNGVEIVIRATRTREILGEGGRRVRELTALVQKRFEFPEDLKIYLERVAFRNICAMTQAESLRFRLMKGVPVRRACYGILRQVMEGGAKGCEISVSGKMRAQRAKTMKFRDGYMISSGEGMRTYITEAERTVQVKLGMMGIKVKIMLSHDPEGEQGPTQKLPDFIEVNKPIEAKKEKKQEEVVVEEEAQPSIPVAVAVQ